jgi:hypothetical protein
MWFLCITISFRLVSPLSPSIRSRNRGGHTTIKIGRQITRGEGGRKIKLFPVFRRIDTSAERRFRWEYVLQESRQAAAQRRNGLALNVDSTASIRTKSIYEFVTQFAGGACDASRASNSDAVLPSDSSCRSEQFAYKVDGLAIP